MKWRALSLLAALCALQGSAQAICSAPQTVRQEAAASDAIVLAKVKAQGLVVSPDDPEGFEATVYTLQIQRRYKGATPRSLQIASPNTSSRFPMETGKEYVLFLKKYPDGYGIDSCGNSAGPARGMRIRALEALRQAGYASARP